MYSTNNSFYELNKRFTQGSLRRVRKPEYDYIPGVKYYYRSTNPKLLTPEYLHNESLEQMGINSIIRSGNRHTYSYSRHLKMVRP